MELRKEYAEIASRVYHEWVNSDIGGKNACTQVALACQELARQELADRPPRELTASEKYHLWLSVYDGVFGSTRCTNGSEVIDKIIAAFLEKQREPQVVKFRAAMNKESGAIEMLRDGNSLPTAWCFLEPAQEFEVRI